MAETFKVKIEFIVDRGFSIPEHISVPLNARIEWVVTDLNVNQSSRRFNQAGLRFHLYFSGDSPFNWNVKTTNLRYPRPQSSGGGAQMQLAPMTHPLAVGIAQQRGDFKYGLRVIDVEHNGTLYDEDPYVHVF